MIGKIKDALMRLSGEIGGVTPGDYDKLRKVQEVLVELSRVSGRTAFLMNHNSGNIPLLCYHHKAFTDNVDEMIRRLTASMKWRDDFYMRIDKFVAGLEKVRKDFLTPWHRKNAMFIFSTEFRFINGVEYPLVVRVYPLMSTREGNIWVTLAVVDRGIVRNTGICDLFDYADMKIWSLDGQCNLACKKVKVSNFERNVCAMLYADYTIEEIAEKLNTDADSVKYTLRKMRRNFGVTNSRALLVLLRIMRML